MHSAITSDAIEQVGPNHGDLVDNDRLQLLEEIQAVGMGLANQTLLYLGMKAKKGMDRLSVNVECGHTGRSQNDMSLPGFLPEVGQ